MLWRARREERRIDFLNVRTAFEVYRIDLSAIHDLIHLEEMEIQLYRHLRGPVSVIFDNKGH